MRVYGIHLLRNALVPIITRASTVLPFLFTGSLLLESFFGIPGLGYEGVNALNSSDLSMLKALVLLGAILFIVINLITDVAYAWVDPRVRGKRDSNFERAGFDCSTSLHKQHPLLTLPTNALAQHF